MRKWYEMEACNQGPIIGGQVYLVRNIMGYPFEAKMNEEEQKALMAAVCYAVRQSEEVLQKKFVFINFSEVRDYEQQALIGKLAIPRRCLKRAMKRESLYQRMNPFRYLSMARNIFVYRYPVQAIIYRKPWHWRGRWMIV